MPIKVLLVEDSPIVQVILKRIVNAAPDMEVVGSARTGVEGLELLQATQPDVICTDLHMPQMDGFKFTAEVMATQPRPILVISASVQEEDRHNVFRLLDAGAVDIFPKPAMANVAEYAAIAHELLQKIRVLAGVRVFTRRRPAQQVAAPPEPVLAPPTPTASAPPPPSLGTTSRYKILAIGASTGGPQALKTLLSALPATLPVPILCVQHISEGFLQGLLDWLKPYCQLPIQLAAPGEYPQAGVIYFPREDLHLELDQRGRFSYASTAKLGGHRPSITLAFQAVAKVYRSSALGVLLTGMGRDGAEGMLAIHRAGGYTIAQAEASCVVFGMPREAIALGAAQQVLPIEVIAPALLSRLMYGAF